MEKEPQAGTTGLHPCPRDCPTCWGYKVNKKDGEACDEQINAMILDISSLWPFQEGPMIAPESGGEGVGSIQYTGGEGLFEVTFDDMKPRFFSRPV